MKMEVENGSVLGPFRSQDTSEIYRQNKAKPLENEAPREGKRATGENTGHHGLGAHHGLTVAGTTGRGSHCGGCPVVFPRAPRFGLSVFRLGPRVLPFLGSFGPLCKLLLILIAHTSLAWIHLKHFSPNLGLNHRNLQ